MEYEYNVAKFSTFIIGRYELLTKLLIEPISWYAYFYVYIGSQCILNKPEKVGKIFVELCCKPILAINITIAETVRRSVD